jgi:hypothetical protein
MPNIARLTTLIECLSALPPENKFDISTYGQAQAACGTTACACGYGALYPPLMEQGFRLVVRDAARTPVTSIEHFNSFEDVDFMVTFDGTTVDFAVGKFFEITREQFEYMFMAFGYWRDDDLQRPFVTIPMVISHIRDVIEGRV